MALLEDMFKGNAVTGVAVGLAAIFLGPTLFPTIGRALRPAAKTVIKGGLVLYRETVAGIGELATDLVAEAKSELEQTNHQDRAGLAATAATAPSAHRESSREKH
jgi:50S ribosomal subunit-associated GTPase HflX